MTTSPTLIVKEPKPHQSDSSQIDTAVSPFEVRRGVDLDDPKEHSREPKRPPPINRNPARKSVQIRSKKHDPKGIHGAIRKIRFPELFHLSRYSVELIAEMQREFPERRDYRVWIDEVIASGVPEDQRRKFVVTKHPGFPQYDALFELVSKPSTGPHFRLVSIAKEKCPHPDYLPAALMSEDGRWDHMRGEMGEPREFTKRDFEIIREEADLRLLGPKGVCEKMEAREAAEYNELDRKENDFVEDMLDYNFDWLRRAANYGRRHYSVPTVVVGENAAKWYIEERNGYKVKVHRGTKIADELENAATERRKLEAHAETEEIAKKCAEIERRRLQEAARASTAPQAIKGRKTL